MNDERRGTGRTTRMLQEAIREAREGKRVFILADNYVHSKTLFNILIGLRQGEPWFVAPFHFRVNVSDPSGQDMDGSITVTTPGQIDFHWDLMRAFTFGPEAVYMVDHFTIESRVNNLLSMLHRWDQPPG
jgi:hypothetical protein